MEGRMKRTLKLLTLALALCFGPATLAAAQLAPTGVEFAAVPVILAQVAPLDLPAAGAVATVDGVELPAVPSWNPADWFKDAALLGVVVAFLVALLKRNFLKDLHGLATLALSFGLGIGLSLLGTVTWPGGLRFNELTGVAAIMFGVNAAVFASGGWDAIKALLLTVFGGKSPAATGAPT